MNIPTAASGFHPVGKMQSLKKTRSIAHIYCLALL